MLLQYRRQCSELHRKRVHEQLRHGLALTVLENAATVVLPRRKSKVFELCGKQLHEPYEARTHPDCEECNSVMLLCRWRQCCELHRKQLHEQSRHELALTVLMNAATVVVPHCRRQCSELCKKQLQEHLRHELTLTVLKNATNAMVPHCRRQRSELRRKTASQRIKA